jgi:DNA-binding transcriptional LysR family regulator
MSNLSRIDLNLLVVLEAIYSEGGVTRAGEKLHLGQPAISHSLARLRDLFHDPLFVRDGRGLAPTPLTHRLVGSLSRSLRSLESLLERRGRFDSREAEAQFTVSMRDPVEVRVLARLMRRITRSSPRIDFRVVQVRRRAIEGALSSGTLDLAIDVPLSLSEKVRRKRLSSDRLAVVVRRGHPRLRAGFKLDAYLQEEHVMVTSRRKGAALEDFALSERGLRRRVRLRCRSYTAALRVVSETDLVLTVPERYARLLDRSTRNRILSLPMAMPRLEAYLYWHESVDDDPANRWLRESVTRAFAI